LSPRRWASLAALRAGTRVRADGAGIPYRCTYRQRLEQVFAEFGWPSPRDLNWHARRHDWLRRADMVSRCCRAPSSSATISTATSASTPQRIAVAVDTVFIQRRAAHQYSALRALPPA